ncbi:MAG: ABC transporter ATP-binding protein [Candidatus Binatia bacterium]
MGAVAATDLRKVYESDGTAVRALDGVDLEVGAGEFVAVMGPSGSGKSTLLHMLGALDVPDEGEVRIDGTALSGMSRRDLALIRRRQVGFVFQFFNLVPVLTVEENVSLPATLDGTDRSEYGPRVDELFELFGLGPHRDKLPSQLSGGEQQRVSIARALVNRPAVVLADEPTGNLDRSSGGDVMSLLHRLNTDGQTIVVVTHDASVASFARRVLFMRDGKLVGETMLESSGDTGEILAKLVQLEM